MAVAFPTPQAQPFIRFRRASSGYSMKSARLHFGAITISCAGLNQKSSANLDGW